MNRLLIRNRLEIILIRNGVRLLDGFVEHAGKDYMVLGCVGEPVVYSENGRCLSRIPAPILDAIAACVAEYDRQFLIANPGRET